MRAARFSGPEGDAVDALVTDQYLDALLGSGDHRGAAEGGLVEGLDAGRPTTPDDLRHAADVVRGALLRVHPSFRFEERLAARLAEFATANGGRAAAVGGARSAAVIPFPYPSGPVGAQEDPLLAAVIEGRLDPADADAVARAAGARAGARPLLVGGAITSAAISLVGVAWVAWRASRPGPSAVAGAAGEAHARGLADLAELATGAHGGPA